MGDVATVGEECVVKPFRDVKVAGSKPAGTKNPTMLRVGVVSQARG